jgi:hypothetical protein
VLLAGGLVAGADDEADDEVTPHTARTAMRRCCERVGSDAPKDGAEGLAGPFAAEVVRLVRASRLTSAAFPSLAGGSLRGPR